MREETKNRIRDVIREAVRDGVTAGAEFLAVKDWEEPFFDVEGYANLEKAVPLRRDHIMRLFSMTKPVTSAAAMILFERGLLDFGEPVRELIPGFGADYTVEEGKKIPCQKEMTVLQLLNMTSGLTYGAGLDPANRATAEVLMECGKRRKEGRPVPTMEFARMLGHAPRLFEPDSFWNYSFSADVLGAVIESVSGMRFGDFLQKEIFGPLGMKDTGFYVPEEKQDRLADVYHSRLARGKAKNKGGAEGRGGAGPQPETGGSRTPDAAEVLEKMFPFRGDNLEVLYDMKTRPAFESGGAGLVSTIDDYMRFLRMILGGGCLDGTRILQERTVKYMLSGQLTPEQQKGLRRHFGLEGYTYSHLFRLMKDPGQCAGLTRPGEFGWDSWTGCFFAGYPEDGLGFIFMEQKAECGTIPPVRKIRNLLLLDPEV